MSKRLSLTLLLIGAFLLMLALSVTVYYRWEDAAAGKSAGELLDTLPGLYMGDTLPQSPANGDGQPDWMPDGNGDLPGSAYGYDVAGVLAIPKLELVLPVLAECSDELLKISVCLYQDGQETGSGRPVIAGHNYKSHFRQLTDLEAGDEIIFTSFSDESVPEQPQEREAFLHRASQSEVLYTVTELADIAETDFEGLEAGDWDLTLFTCDFTGRRRILVRAELT